MSKLISAWLLLCCALVLVILVSGGVTRLTHSGLSIVEWKPVVGTIPPLNSSQWDKAFDQYRRTPEYQQINAGMSLQDFKSIYWMEYAHRLLGRLAGLVFIVPFFYFALSRRIGGALVPRLAVIALLWALQGAMGWYMVSSGLVDVPRVSHYRLTAHLIVACLLYAAMFWTALDLLPPAGGALPKPRVDSLRRVNMALLGLVFITIVSGGLVAGLKAGQVYNTFPRMGGYWIPPFLLDLEPPARNFFANVITVQFDHRVLALLLALGVVGIWLRGLKPDCPKRARIGFHVLLGAMAAQIALGISALLYAVPVALGAAHQANALLVLTSFLFIQHELA